MLYKYFTEKLTGLQGLSIEKVEENQNTIHIHCKLERKKHKCPCCGKLTNTIHDYREQVIKDIPAFGKYVFIHIKKKRYRCTCGKRFAEKNKFLPRYHRMTNRLSAYIIDKLRDAVTYTSVAREMNLSVNTVIRVFGVVDYGHKNLPSALSIDEFKGNTGGEKYQCIITDPVKRSCLIYFLHEQKYVLPNILQNSANQSVKMSNILSVICGNLLLTSQRRGLRTQSRS